MEILLYIYKYIISLHIKPSYPLSNNHVVITIELHLRYKIRIILGCFSFIRQDAVETHRGSGERGSQYLASDTFSVILTNIKHLVMK